MSHILLTLTGFFFLCTLVLVCVFALSRRNERARDEG